MCRGLKVVCRVSKNYWVEGKAIKNYFAKILLFFISRFLTHDIKGHPTQRCQIFRRPKCEMNKMNWFPHRFIIIIIIIKYIY